MRNGGRTSGRRGPSTVRARTATAAWLVASLAPVATVAACGGTDTSQYLANITSSNVADGRVCDDAETALLDIDAFNRDEPSGDLTTRDVAALENDGLAMVRDAHEDTQLMARQFKGYLAAFQRTPATTLSEKVSVLSKFEANVLTLCQAYGLTFSSPS